MSFLSGVLSVLTGGISNIFKDGSWNNLGNILNNAGDTASDIGNQNMLGNYVAKYTGSRLTNAEQQANAFNATEAQKQRDFEQAIFNQQTELSNTAFRRQVADMQAAGINPLMAANAGGSAVPSAVSGSAASSVSPSGAALNLGTLLQFALESRLLPAKIANLAADTAKKNAEASSTVQQVDFFARIASLRKDGERLSNDLKRSQMKEIEQSINESKARENDAITHAVLNKANADNLVFLQPYVAAELSARSSSEKAQAKSALVGAAYQQGLIDAGVIEQSIKASNASISVDNAIAEINRVNALIAKGDKHALSRELGTLDKIDFWARDVISAITKVVDSVPINFVVK